jgi:Pyridoxamine 5'-phosphate oxidase
MAEPEVEQLPLPPVYGSPKKKLEWAVVRKELEDAPTYWVASTRPDGRPHVVPRDGIWLDDTWYYGGSGETVHNRNVGSNPAVVMHIGDGIKATIVEGEVTKASPTRQVAQRLSDVNNVKYEHYGMNTTADTYLSGDYLALRARRVIAWTFLPEDATRFVFPLG